MKGKLIKEIILNFIIWVIAATAIQYTIMYFEYREDVNYHIERFNYTPLTFIPSAILIAVTSVSHYYILYARYFQKGKIGQYIIGILCLLILSVLVDGLLVLSLRRGLEAEIKYLDVVPVSIMRNAYFVTPAALFYTLLKANVSLRKRRQQLERQQLESNIAALKQQLEPHFLFNTLNTIYATAMQENAGRTAQSIEELSSLFRYSILEAGMITVPIEKELSFIEKYLHLQRLRLSETRLIIVTTNIFWDKRPAEIAPMLLLPFIENAFKYGISYRYPSVVDISIAIKQGTLHADISNTDFSSGHEKSTGIGLDNTMKKLQLQYAGKYKIQQYTENEMYRVSLSIQLV